MWLRPCAHLYLASRRDWLYVLLIYAPHAKNYIRSILGCLLLTGFFRWSVGSVLFLLSWAVLMGPWSYAKHLISGARLPFTAAYFGSIALTLYFAIGVSTSIYSDFLLSPQRTTRLGSLPFCVLARYALPRSTPTIPICYFHSISLFVAPCYTPIRKVWLHCTTGNRGILQPSRPSRGTT